MSNIIFPHLNLYFNINSVAFTIFGIDIYWYGIIITSGIILGLILASYIAKKENMNPDIITDFLLYDLIFAVIGARAYFVLFNWSYYKKNPLEIINTRQGGLAIYGGIIASIVVAIIYAKIRKINLLKFFDVTTYGLLVGQILGRYGNFFNKEAFGDYTNNLLAMRILKSEAKPPLSQNILDHIVKVNGQDYIQVHPTFFYESCWNIIVLVGLLFYRRYKKNNGEIFFIYIAAYGIGRFFVESLRTDQLLIGGTHIAISQVVAVISILLGIFGIYQCRKNTPIN